MSSVPPREPGSAPPSGAQPGGGTRFASADGETWARGLVSSLFDVHFDTFLTRRIAWLVYVLGLVAIGLSAVVRFVSALASLFVPTSPAAVIWAFLTAFVAVPIATALAVLVWRILVELAVSVVTLAENARHSTPPPSEDPPTR